LAVFPRRTDARTFAQSLNFRVELLKRFEMPALPAESAGRYKEIKTGETDFPFHLF
jgi:hypothetical protein